jgi:hypothetical protein
VSLLNPKTFLLRPDATAVLREAGVPATDSTLESLAVAGKGPRYAVLNGRAVYLRADLEQWLESQVRRTPNAAA